MIAELVGGELDGVRLRLAHGRGFIWVDTRLGHVAYSSPGRCRVLYRLHGRLIGRTDNGEPIHLYATAELTHRRCEGCGALVELVDGHVGECSLCGTPLIRPG